MRFGRGRGVALAVLALGGSSIAAQQFGDFDTPRAKTKDFVAYAAEQQTAVAGKRSVLELDFHVLDGLHVNSHTPKSELLIPTTLTLDAAPGVKLGELVYPAGSTYSFSASPDEKMDVYSGGFAVKLPVVAQPGTHTIEGKLRYQACDHAACYPPKMLPVEIVLAAK
jgi:Disulphide bond corrector protein DsbC